MCWLGSLTPCKFWFHCLCRQQGGWQEDGRNSWVWHSPQEFISHPQSCPWCSPGRTVADTCQSGSDPHRFPQQREGISGYLLKPVWVNRASQVTCRKRAGGWDPAGSCESGMAPSYRGFVLVKIGSYSVLSLWVISAAPLVMPLLGLTRCRCRNGS